MGREKGYKLSEERIRRMKLAKERKKLGFTRHIHIVEEIAQRKIEELFKEWSIDLKEARFIVEGCDKEFNLIPELRKENVKHNNVAGIAIGFFGNQKVREVGIRSYNEEVLELTEGTGNVVYIQKVGAEYLVQDYNQI